MILISATGGSGSTFVVSTFKKHKWKVCERPDGGRQKANRSIYSIWDSRCSKFFKTPKDKKYNQKQLFDICYNKLKKLDKKKIMLMCMSWGGLGYLNEIEEKPIYLIRNPIFAFNSYSGGGWRKEGGKRRIKYVGAKNQNDKKWIDLFLGDFSYWIDGAKYALEAVENNKGYIVRYDNFKEDWKKIPDVPPVHKYFDPKDDMKKIKGYLTDETISYIKEKTKDIWNNICKL